MWIGIAIGGIVLLLELMKIVALVSNRKDAPAMAHGFDAQALVVDLCGGFYWLYCIYRMHKVLRQATNSSYPISPGKAVGYHFIPFYCFLVWPFRWTGQIAQFVNRRSPYRPMKQRLAGWLLCLVGCLGTLSSFLAPLIVLSPKVSLPPLLQLSGVPLALAVLLVILSPGVCLLISFGVGVYIEGNLNQVLPEHVRCQLRGEMRDLCLAAAAGLSFGFVCVLGLWDFVYPKEGTSPHEVFAHRMGAVLAAFMVTFLVLWFVDPVLEWARALKGIHKEHEEEGGPLSSDAWLTIVIAALIATAAHGVVHQKAEEDPLRAFQVLVAGLGSSGLITYSWIMGARRGRSQAAKYGLLTGTLAGVFFMVMSASGSASPEGIRGIAPVAWIPIWALMGLFGGLAIGKGSGARGVSLSIAAAALPCALLLVVPQTMLPFYKHYLVMALFALAGWSVGIRAFSFADRILRASSAATDSTRASLTAGEALLPAHLEDARPPIRKQRSWQLASVALLALFVLALFIHPAPGAPAIGRYLTLQAHDATRFYGAPEPAVGYSMTGFVAGDTASDVTTGTPRLVTPATAESPIGSYPIYIGQGTFAARNYSVNFVPGTLTVVPAQSTVALSASALQIPPNSPVSFQAVVTPETSGVPTGKILFRDGVRDLGSASLMDGRGTLTTKLSGNGAHVVRAWYSGDRNFDPSSAAGLEVVVSQGSPDIVKKHDHETHDTHDIVRPAVRPALVVPAGTSLTVRTSSTIDSSINHAGQDIAATLVTPLVLNGGVVAPAGSAALLRLTSVDSAGHLRGRPSVTIQLAGVTVGRHFYTLNSAPIVREGASRGVDTAKKAGIGAAVGGAIGGIFGHKKGAAIGAGSGAGGAVAYQTMTNAAPVSVPAETVLTFTLAHPVSIPAGQ